MKTELKSYGLSDKEIEIYLSCLKLGSCTGNRLSEVSGIRRSTVYEVIESLKKKGLVTSHRQDKKLFFTALPPQTLLELLREKEHVISAIIPDLNRIAVSVAEKPKVELFEGLTGVKHALNEMLDYKEILVYGAGIVADQVLGSYTANFAQKRAERHVVLKAVVERTVPKHMLEPKIRKVTYIRTIPRFKQHNTAYFIYGHKILIASLGLELIAVRITSPPLAESQRKIFSLLWDTA